MAKVIIGNDIKLLVNIDKVDNISMRDMDFTIDVTCYGYKQQTITFKKNECVPENGGIDGYKVCFCTTDLGIGDIIVRVTAHLPDGDFYDGKRQEIVDVDTGIQIVKML